MRPEHGASVANPVALVNGKSYRGCVVTVGRSACDARAASLFLRLRREPLKSQRALGLTPTPVTEHSKERTEAEVEAIKRKAAAAPSKPAE